MAGNVWGRLVSSAKSITRGRLLQSYVDEIMGNRIRGWVRDPSRPGRRLAIQVFVGSTLIATDLADRFRQDLLNAQIGDGCHSFDIELPVELVDGNEHLLYVRTKEGADLAHSPRLLKPTFQGSLDKPDGSVLKGWAWNPYAPADTLKLDVFGNQLPLATIEASLYRADLEEAGVGEGHHAFRFELPPNMLDGRDNSISVRIAGTNHELDCSPLTMRAEFEGCFDGFSGDHVQGWAWNKSSPKTPIVLDVYINDELLGTVSATRFRADLLNAGKSDGCIAFQLKLPPRFSRSVGFVISAKIAGSDVHLNESPKLIMPSAVLRHAVTTLHAHLNEIWQQNSTHAETSEGTLANGPIGRLDPYACEYIRRALLPAVVNALPASPFISLPLDQTRQPVAQNPFPDTRYSQQPVDVVVPVYQGIDETLACLASLAAARVSVAHEVIVLIDDPDPVIYRPVIELAQKHDFTVFVNLQNGGFVRTVNRGFRLHTNRDVVLLNSDTVVHGDWLGRLRTAAYSHLSIGTVTPLSNNASICSYPSIHAPGKLPSAQDLARFDEICEKHNRGQVEDIPSAVGFCMYVRRSCLIDVGLFDEALWSRGYGEENDFCLRASRNGWRNVAATDVFVAHAGNTSFGAERGALVARNSETLSRMYPTYNAMVAEFVNRDPLLPFRRRIDLALLDRAMQGGILHITADLDGGSSRSIRDLAERLSGEGVPSVILSAKGRNRVSFHVIGFEKELRNLVYDLEHEFEELIAALRHCGIRHIHYHQRNTAALLKLPAALGIPYDVTVHDYSWICPQVTLIDESNVFCGEPPIEVCEKCVKLNGTHPLLAEFFEDRAVSVSVLRSSSADFLAGARKIYCPNQDVYQRLCRYFPAKNIVMKPHPEIAARNLPAVVARRADEKLRVGVIGAIGPHKGYDILLACARLASQRRLPIEFVVLGYTSGDAALQALDNVFLTGRYKETELAGLIQRHRISIAFFPSVCPETYSFTLSMAFTMGLYPVAFQLGSIAERIGSTGYGSVIPLTQEPEVCLEALFAAAKQARTAVPPTKFAASYDNVLFDYYELSQDHNAFGAAAAGNGGLHLPSENGKH